MNTPIAGGAISIPVVQLDVKEMDLIELGLGGLADRETIGSVLNQVWEVLNSHPGQDPDREESSVMLADPDGTVLAKAGLRRSAPTRWTLQSLETMRRAEHGPCRESRITAPLGDKHVVLFDQEPQATDLVSLQKLEIDLSATIFVLVSGATAAYQPGYPGTVEQVCAAAQIADAAAAGHLIIPAGLEEELVINRLTSGKIHDLRRHRTPEGSPAGMVMMLSGLSGSGKSTLARALQEHLHRQTSRPVVLLDGDDVRRFVSKGLGFSREDRETNVARIGWIAARISESGGIAICAPIAPFAQARSTVRELAEAVGAYHLFHVSTPLEVCEERDRKGLYAKARAGLIPDFTGIDSPYEVPTDADLRLNLAELSIAQATAAVDEYLKLSSKGNPAA